MMEVVLTRLRDFSRKSATFDDIETGEQSACRESRSRGGHPRDGRPAGGQGRKLDIQSALAWLRRELMEMRSQDQALIRQLMELHSGIQELKQELSEEEVETDEEEREEEEGSCWDSESEQESSSVYSSSGEVGSSSSYLRVPRRLHAKRRASCRRSSVP